MDCCCLTKLIWRFTAKRGNWTGITSAKWHCVLVKGATTLAVSVNGSDLTKLSRQHFFGKIQHSHPHFPQLAIWNFQILRQRHRNPWTSQPILVATTSQESSGHRNFSHQSRSSESYCCRFRWNGIHAIFWWFKLLPLGDGRTCKTNSEVFDSSD